MHPLIEDEGLNAKGFPVSLDNFKLLDYYTEL